MEWHLFQNITKAGDQVLSETGKEVCPNTAVTWLRYLAKMNNYFSSKSLHESIGNENYYHDILVMIV